ncbi:hypothetical protein, partial [Pseudomonas extremaustralis]|uniref:hypothetical protein n=1 Tax=Pseudomonas extremaustralis TaxID=359110 RepID=UPI001ED8C10A
CGGLQCKGPAFLCNDALAWLRCEPQPLASMPFGKSMQSVSAFLVWCSTFSQGWIFYPQDAASTFFNEML